MNPVTNEALTQFVVAEARLLNEGQYDAWLALFAPEGRYWIPLQGASQREGAAYNALADEDPLLLALRIERLKSPRAYSQQPRSHSQHVIQAPQVDQRDDAANRYVLHTPFMYVEARGNQQLLLTGHWQHTLCLDGGALRIALKRVNLLNPGAQFPAIQLFP